MKYLLLGLVLFLPGLSHAAIAYDNSAIGSGGAVQNPSTTFTTTGTNRALLVVVWNGTDGANTSLACSYGGVAMTNEGFEGGTGGGAAVTGFSLLNPASGSNTLSCTSSASKGYYFLIASYTGVDQTTGIDDTILDSDNGTKTTTETLSVTASGTGDWGVFLNTSGQALTLSTNLNAERAAALGNIFKISDSNASLGGAGSYNLTYTQANDWWYGGMAVALKPAAAAASPTSILGLVRAFWLF